MEFLAVKRRRGVRIVLAAAPTLSGRFRNEITVFPNPELVPPGVTLLSGSVVRRYRVEVSLPLFVPGTGGLS